MNENLKREYEGSIFKAFGVTFTEFARMKRHNIEVEIDYILFPNRKENYKRRIDTILNEYMHFITPLI